VPGIVQIAQRAGFDAVFIDLEHSTFSLNEAGILSTTAILIGITPFVRVPYECGQGYVQKVLDCGAVGVIFPHVSSEGKLNIMSTAKTSGCHDTGLSHL
jgi:2-keto-3-deoxy-L-rhamnonate aldolase RhmA